MLWLERKYLSMSVGSLELAKWKGDTTLNHRCYTGVIRRRTNIKLVGITLSSNKVLYLSVTTVVNLPQV